MTTIVGVRGLGHFPTPSVPQAGGGLGATGTALGQTIGSLWPSNPGAVAGVVGSLVLNGVSIPLDLTMLKGQDVVRAINAAQSAVVASIGPFANRLVLTAPGAINIGGPAALQYALGLQ
jgi:hypothetical protein